jgi:predicted TIM-barrel fold metal-dependent hydrolase
MFEAMLHKDQSAVNARLARECAQGYQVKLLPFGCVNPQLPDWREDLRRCVEVHRMPGLRLYPGAHGYGLTDPQLLELLAVAAERKVFVQIVVTIEDSRTQHPLVKLPAVDLAPLPGVLAGVKGLKLQLLNVPTLIPDEILVPLARTGQVWFDFAMVEGLSGVARFAERAGTERLLLGSYFPLFYTESALLKLVESGLPDSEQEAIRGLSAEALVKCGS